MYGIWSDKFSDDWEKAYGRSKSRDQEESGQEDERGTSLDDDSQTGVPGGLVPGGRNRISDDDEGNVDPAIEDKFQPGSNAAYKGHDPSIG